MGWAANARALAGVCRVDPRVMHRRHRQTPHSPSIYSMVGRGNTQAVAYTAAASGRTGTVDFSFCDLTGQPRVLPDLVKSVCFVVGSQNNLIELASTQGDSRNCSLRWRLYLFRIPSSSLTSSAMRFQSAALTLLANCSGFFAPVITEQTCGCAKSQACANSFTPRP